MSVELGVGSGTGRGEQERRQRSARSREPGNYAGRRRSCLLPLKGASCYPTSVARRAANAGILSRCGNGLTVSLDIPDFTDAERRAVATALRERYQRDLPLEEVDAELRLDPASPLLTPCPALSAAPLPQGARGEDGSVR